MVTIDQDKAVYLFVHGRKDLEESSKNLLVENGFSKDKIIIAKSDIVGNIGDYMALLWAPRNPSVIKIQKITKVEKVERPEGVLGVWKGVTWDDIFEIPLAEK
ncbi:MAG: hypothetical protein OEL69_03185 [Nitrosopumilus sp.]|nr:hypothetical protein [Nitrosopumilus sp.]